MVVVVVVVLVVVCPPKLYSAPPPIATDSLVVAPIAEVPYPTPPSLDPSIPNCAPAPTLAPTPIEAVPYPTPPTPGPSIPNWPPSTFNPVVVVFVVVVTCVFPKAVPASPLAPKPAKSTLPPTGGRTLVPKSTVFLIVVVVIPCPIVAPPSTTPRFVVPKSTVPRFVVPKSTVPRFVVPKSTVWWVVVPKSRAWCVVVPKSRAWCVVVPKSTAAWVVVPKSIALCTVVVAIPVAIPSLATPEPRLIDALSTLFLTISGLTWLLTTSLITEVLTISLWTCPLISCVASVSFLYIVG